jgi:uncharacterized protein
MLALTIAAAAVAGLVLGLLGGGGSMLTLPILVYLAGMPTRPAIAASLFVVAATSAIALIPHARARRVRWRTAAPFALTGVLGAYAGGRAADLIPATVLLIGFGLMMAAAATAMLRPSGGSRGDTATGPATSVPRQRPVAQILVLGGLVGLVTGPVGAGGGFVIVPVLTLLAGLPMAEAVGTSLFVIAVQSTAGLAGHLHSVHLNWPLTLAVTAAAITGSLIGARSVGRVRQAALRAAFGIVVIAMAALVLLQQTPTAARHWLTTTPAGWATLTTASAALTAVIRARVRTRRRDRTPARPAAAEPTLLDNR